MFSEMRRTLLQNILKSGNVSWSRATCPLSVRHVSGCHTLYNTQLKLSPVMQSGSSLPGKRYYSDDSPDKPSEGASDDNKLVLVEKMENLHIMTIGINRPDKRNAVNTETAEELKLAFQEFEADDNMYCAGLLIHDCLLLLVVN